MTKWEYKGVKPAAYESHVELAVLNALGNDGWELVSITTDGNIRYYFRRPSQK